jgi:DNA polymerase III subunit delta
MKLKPEQLASHLRQGVLPLYWLAGDEPLLIQEAADQIRQRCRNLGFQDRESYLVDRIFDWNGFRLSISNLSLFSQQKLFELRLTTAKLDDAGKDALQEYIDSGNPDYVLLVSSPRLEAATLNTRWFKSLEKTAGFVQVWPLSDKQLHSWLQRRLVQHGITASPEALRLLIDKVEGNLLAALQEIEKLKLSAGNPKDQPIRLDANSVLESIADSSRYTIFQLIDAALQADSRRTLKIVQALRNEGTELPPMLGAISKELTGLLAMAEQVQAGQSADSAANAAYVNFTRKPAVVKCLQRLGPDQFWALLDHLRIIDLAIKGMSLADPWDELTRLFLHLAGVHLILEDTV